KRFLNLFCYTAPATVYAVAGGAVSTVSVDMSPVYLEWAGRNFKRNGIDEGTHRLIQADCLEWIAQCPTRFDLIFLDPPTFSNSKRMSETIDIQRDHVRLIVGTARLLAPGGMLLFSTNRSKFKIDTAGLADLRIEDISERTIPRDFERNPKIHRCWKITRGEKKAGNKFLDF
ncbi:MAG: class I SAM-dependent methyltransferase, partial [Spirochaetes bacterium]|nr:class I SAM-dependent methyltransferase [Spirochaetota bacterium]